MSDAKSTKPKKKCGFPGCERPFNGKGLCIAHGKQKLQGKPLAALKKRRPNGSEPVIEHEEIPCENGNLKGPCHVFLGAKSSGYGVVGSKDGKRNVFVHRYVWEKANGPIPLGMVIDHMCMNRSCCNVDHLRVVTHKVNTTENLSAPSNWMIQKAKTHCKRGHEFTEENTYRMPKGGRCCNTWRRERANRINQEIRLSRTLSPPAPSEGS